MDENEYTRTIYKKICNTFLEEGIAQRYAKCLTDSAEEWKRIDSKKPKLDKKEANDLKEEFYRKTDYYMTLERIVNSYIDQKNPGVLAKVLIKCLLEFGNSVHDVKGIIPKLLPKQI